MINIVNICVCDSFHTNTKRGRKAKVRRLMYEVNSIYFYYMFFTQTEQSFRFATWEKSPTAGAAKLVFCLMAILHFQMLS